MNPEEVARLGLGRAVLEQDGDPQGMGNSSAGRDKNPFFFYCFVKGLGWKDNCGV